MYYGIYSFYYSEIDRYKKSSRNQLIYFTRYSGEEAKLTADAVFLAKLFLVDADNIGGELYTEEDLDIIDPILDAYLNGENLQRELTMDDVRMFLNFAMRKRLTTERNEQLAMKLAEEYNQAQHNELLLINMDVFREVCRSIDTAKI